MKNIKKILVLLLLLIPTFVNAKEVNNLYTKFDDDISLSDNVKGSAVIGADNLTVSNEIEGIGLIMGNSVNYKATSDYLVLMGNIVSVDGIAKNDGLFMGNIIKFSNNSIVNRDTIILGNEVTLSGTFLRNVRIYANKIILEDVKISGRLYTSSEKLIIKSTASVSNIIEYNETVNLVKEEGSNVEKYKSYEVIEEEKTILDTFLSFFKSLISMLFILILTIFITPKLLNKVESKYSDKDMIIKNIGIGFISIIIIPLVLILFVLSSMSITAGAVFAMLYIIFIILSKIISSYVLGNLLWKKYINKKPTMYLKGSLGVLVYCILSYIPFLNILVIMAFVLFGFGSLISLVWDNKKKK